MAQTHSFRSAFHGFNREDVVHYIEYVNNKHNDLVNQLNSEKQALLEELNALRAQAPQEDLSEKLAALEEECAQLKAHCAELEAKASAPAASNTERTITEEELEAYRRAERTERLARERAEKVYHRVNGVLADATVKVDDAAAQIGELADQVMSQLNLLQSAASGSKQALQDAVETMYALRPTSEE